jgi:hypothetical protein
MRLHEGSVPRIRTKGEGPRWPSPLFDAASLAARSRGRPKKRIQPALTSQAFSSLFLLDQVEGSETRQRHGRPEYEGQPQIAAGQAVAQRWSEDTAHP